MFHGVVAAAFGHITVEYAVSEQEAFIWGLGLKAVCGVVCLVMIAIALTMLIGARDAGSEIEMHTE